MKLNRLGRSELIVSEIGLGCMSLGTEEAKARSIVDQAVELGINFFDTADLYDHGTNEEFLGQALKGRRNKVILATKVGNRRIPGQAGWSWDPSKAYIKAAVHESLRRLQTDYIDLYQLHGGTMDDPIDETIEAFEELVQEGWIRYYGISSIRPNVIREYVRRSNIVTVMSQYSLLDRRPEEETLDLLHHQGISLIARGPLAGGILSTHGLKKAVDGYLDYNFEEVRNVHSFVTDLAGESRTIEQVALRFSLSHPAVAVAIPGARTIEQLRSNVSAGQIPALTESELAEIRQHTKANVYTLHRS